MLSQTFCESLKNFPFAGKTFVMEIIWGGRVTCNISVLLISLNQKTVRKRLHFSKRTQSLWRNAIVLRENAKFVRGTQHFFKKLLIICEWTQRLSGERNSSGRECKTQKYWNLFFLPSHIFPLRGSTYIWQLQITRYIKDRWTEEFTTVIFCLHILDI